MITGVFSALSTALSRKKTISVPLQDLGEAVKPFIYEKGEDKFTYDDPVEDIAPAPVKPFNWNTDLTPEFVAEGWHWAATYLQAAFCDENPKGDMYHSLHHALKGIENSLKRAAPEAKSIEIKREHLAILKATYQQFYEAQQKFEATSAIQKRGGGPIVQFRSGQLAQISALPFNKFPGADHAAVAQQMKMTAAKMRVLTDKADVTAARGYQLVGYKAHHLRHEL